VLEGDDGQGRVALGDVGDRAVGLDGAGAARLASTAPAPRPP
jgi:hypothetical protein